MIPNIESGTRWGRGIFIVILFMLPTVTYSHAFGSRYDLPLPLAFYLSAAGIAVAASFLVTFFFIGAESSHRFRLTFAISSKLSSFVCKVLRIFGLIVLILILTAALTGDASPTKNLATVSVWVLWWVGVVLFSALIINLWPLINPFYTIAQWVCRFFPPRKDVLPLPLLASYMAVIGFLFLSWIELVSNISETPVQLFFLIIIYLVFTCFFARRYGIDSWFNNADPLNRMFDLLGRAAPISFWPSSELVIRFPGSGLLQHAGTKSQIAQIFFIVALMAAVLFDGLSETPIWQAVLNFFTQSQAWRPVLLEMKSAGIDILSLLKTGGLLVVFLIAIAFYGLLTLSIWLAVNRQISLGLIARRFVFSLLPIVIAYHLAHYISYFLLAGQLIFPIISDPFGLGWNLFGTRVLRIDLSVINAEDVWWIALIAIVMGHVISVFVAHGEAIRLFPERALAIRSQIPMMIFMVLLTLCSLWILAQPIVN